MDNWFEVEKIDNNTYAISEYKHWEKFHSYLLIGNKNALLIDTGLGIDNIKNIVDSITSLPIIVATTHIHWDHIGGHKYFDNIYVHENELSWLSEEFPIPLDIVKNNLLKGECDFPKNFNIDEYKVFKGNPTKVLKDGDIINLGDRVIKIIHTPGHSPGHICFYEEESGYIFTGDLVYSGKLDIFYPSTNPIDFMNSIEKIKDLEIERVFPAHYSLDIKPSLIEDIYDGFLKLENDGLLEQGNGVFEFKDFKIHI